MYNKFQLYYLLIVVYLNYGHFAFEYIYLFDIIEVIRMLEAQFQINSQPKSSNTKFINE